MSGSAKVGWSPKEIVWLRAALTLPAYACLCALDDIASMSGRTISAVKNKAKEIHGENIPPAQSRRQHAKGLYVPADSLPPELRAIPRRVEG